MKKSILFIILFSVSHMSFSQSNKNNSVQSDKIRKELGSMFEVERKIELHSNAIYKSENKIYLLKSDIDLIQIYIKREEKELLSNNSTLANSLKEFIKVKDEGLAGSLFSGKTLHESATSNEISKKVYNSVLLDAERRMIRLKSLEREKKKATESLALLKQKSKKLDRARKALLGLQTEKKKKLQSLFKNSDSTKKTINEFSKAYNIRLSVANIENLKNDLKSSFFTSEGKVVHPTKRKLIQSYGFWRHPVYGYKRILKGNTYSLDRADKIYAVGPGIVKYSGPIVGDKKVLIVDHGGKYYSVYKGLVESFYKAGGRVKKGDAIASATVKSRLYFEIRHYSDPINLNRWMIARK